MTRLDRRRLVADLRAGGASLRMIASLSGVALTTVVRDLALDPPDRQPVRVLGLDGKCYPPKRGGNA